jgi:peptide/nickel transport system substrate-binding protein
VRAVVTEELRLGNEPRALAVVGGRLWAALAATGAGHRGGTLRVAFNGALDRIDLDPGTSYNSDAWGFLSLTHDGLTAFRRAGGRAGTQLVPDLAESIPAPSDGGRTYTFSVRRGVRFSTGQTVRPSDLKRGIERSRQAEPAAFGHLDGIASIAVDDAAGTLVIRLKRPDPDFLYRLALPFAVAVPPGTGEAPRIVPATGPYRIATFDRGRRLRLERNRYYRTWSPLAKPDGYADVIDIRMNVDADAAVEAVRAGRVDWTPVGRTATGALAALRRGSPGLARDVILMQTTWVFLNTRVPPFDDADARRAVGLAIDRRAAVAAVGGEHSARLTCHILPPTAPGYRPSCPTRDLAQARRLVRRSGTRGARVTLWSGTPEFDPLNPIIADALRSLGYRTRVRKVSMEEYFSSVSDASKRVQIGPTSWVADYPSASNFLDSFSCRGLRAAFSGNYSQYCDRRVDALMERASAAQTTDPGTADALWARAERRVLDAAVAVPLLNPINVDLVSARLRNEEQSPQWGFLVDQAWVR